MPRAIGTFGDRWHRLVKRGEERTPADPRGIADLAGGVGSVGAGSTVQVPDSRSRVVVRSSTEAWEGDSETPTPPAICLSNGLIKPGPGIPATPGDTLVLGKGRGTAA